MSEKKVPQIIDRFAKPGRALGDLVLDRFILGTPKRISREAPVIILRHEGSGTFREVVPTRSQPRCARSRSHSDRGVGDDEPGRPDAALRASDRHRKIVTVPVQDRQRSVLGGGASSLKHQVARYDIEDVLPENGPWRTSVRENLATVAPAAGAVAISDYGYGCVQPDALASFDTETAQRPWLCLDSRYRIGSFAGVDGATPNLQELEAHCGRRLESDADVADGAEELRRTLAARFLLATRGNRGMTLVETDREPVHIPVFGSDQVADVTGAGDTVLAVLTAALAAGAEPVTAARLANIAAGLVVMKLGTASVSAAELRAAVESV